VERRLVRVPGLRRRGTGSGPDRDDAPPHGRRAADRRAEPRAGQFLSEADLIAAIAAAPDDDAPRLVYADWLQARDDPRGELIALECRLAAGADPALSARADELRAAHLAAWLAPLYAIVPEAGFELRRGLVEHAALHRDDDLEVHGAALLEAAPLLRSVAIRGATLALPPGEAFARLEVLTLNEASQLGAAPIAAFAASPTLARLRTLRLVNCMLDRDELEALLPFGRSRPIFDVHLNRPYAAPTVDAAWASAHLPPRAPFQTRPIYAGEIAGQIRAGKLIMAIKLHRGLTGAGLLESKLAVERMADELRAR
jgi:uncharacterized protein (TIGR02996 family)